MSLVDAMQKGDYSPKQLLDACGIECNGEKRNASIGMGLENLNSLGQIPAEFDGDLDGIDALCYHLDIHTCQKAIKTLERIIKRFNEM